MKWFNFLLIMAALGTAVGLIVFLLQISGVNTMSKGFFVMLIIVIAIASFLIGKTMKLHRFWSTFWGWITGIVLACTILNIIVTLIP